MAEKAKLETLTQRAELILQLESLMSKAERENPQYHPKYLHALVAADEVEEKSLGDKVETKISANDQKIDKVEEKVDKMEEKMDGLKDDMAKVMAMLEAMQRN